LRPDGLDYAVNRYRREAERHYRALDSHLAGRDYIVGSDYTIVDMSAWGWIDRASRVMKGADDPLAPLPSVKRWFTAIDGRLAVARARGRNGSRVQGGERRENEACALPVELPRDRRLGRSRVSYRRNRGNGNDNSTAFPNAWLETNVPCGVSTGTTGRAAFAFAGLFLC
jgi:hypothetical protein